MGRFSKTLKKYERQFLLALVVLLLLTFSVGGAIQCQDKRGEAAVDYGGEYLVTPTKTEGLDSNAFVAWLRRLDGYRTTVRTPSLRYEAFLRQAPADERMRGTWNHVLGTEAARAAGYEVGEEWQLKAAVQRAVESVMRGMPYNDATYDRFIRETYRRPSKDFEQVIREIVMKDAFVRPLIETPRFGISYEQAYETWKNLVERVELEYVALAGPDYNVPALKRERTRDRIGAQLGLLDDVSRTARDLAKLAARVDGWRGSHDGAAPETLDELTDTRRKDAWGNEFRYAPTEGGYDLRSAGPDAAFDSSDDVTPRTVAQIKTRAALREVGAALRRWREATEAWPETLDAMREAPTEGALAPLTGTARDVWENPLVYDASGDVPTLSSSGPDGEAGTADDIPAVVTTDGVLVPPGRELVAYLLDEDKDVWERPFRIDLAHPLTWQWSVVSAGADGEFGTEDDLSTGNHAEIEAFYEQPGVKIEFEVPEKKEFEAISVHLPLVPDETLAWLLETYPRHRPDEEEAFNRWRQLHEYSYYMAEDPTDPASGHGAEHARAVAPDQPAILVPASTVFGEPPAGFLGEDDPDRTLYVERGWRPILLREVFLENVLNDLLTRARDGSEAVRAWDEKRARFEAGEGEDPGEAPQAVSFQDLLDGELKDFLPKADAAPWLQYFRTAEPLARADIETLPNLGDINLTLALQGLKRDGAYAATPTILNDSHTKALLHLVKDHPRHDRPLAEVRDTIFDRFVESKRLDLAAKALESLRADAVRVKPVTAGGPSDGEEAPESPEPEAVWTRTLEAWMAAQDIPAVHERTGVFVGAKPPSAETVEEGTDAAEAARIQRRDFVRATGYDALRAGLKAEERLTPGAIATTILRDDLSEGSDSVFLVRVKSVDVPPRAAFSPRAYADYLSAEILGGPKGGRRLGAGSGAGQVTGSLWEGLRHFYFDYAWLKSKFDLVTEADPDAQMQE